MSKKFSSHLMFAMSLLISSCSCPIESKLSGDIFSKFLQTARETGINNKFMSPLSLGDSNLIGDLVATGSDGSSFKISGGENCFGNLNADIKPVSVPFSYEQELKFDSNSKIETILKLFENGLGKINFGISYDYTQNAKIKFSNFEGKSASFQDLSDYLKNLNDKNKIKTCYEILNQSNSSNISILLGTLYIDSVAVNGDSNVELKIGNEIIVEGEGIESVTKKAVNGGKLSFANSPAKSQFNYKFATGKVPVSGKALKTSDALYQTLIEILKKGLPIPTPTPTSSPNPNPSSEPPAQPLTTQGIFGCWQKQNSSEQACFGESAILQKYPNLSEEQKNLIKAAAPHVYVLNEVNQPPSIFKQYEVLNEKLFLYEDPAKCAKISKIKNQLQLPNFVETATGNCNETGSPSLWDPLTTGAQK